MDLSNLTKQELLTKCDELGLLKVKSKTKSELISLINNAAIKTLIVENDKDIVSGSDSESDYDENLIVVDEENVIIDINNDNNDNDNNGEIDSINHQNKKIDLSSYKFIDLFCGIGGFHQALHKMGAKCVLACDIDKECRIVYKDNYGIDPVCNVKDIDENTMPDFDIICAGFPCQSFSNGGNKKCFEDERGLLFDEIIRIAKVKKPKFMFLENVKHILKVSNGEVIDYIKKKIANTGYRLQIFNMSPHNYGIPQQRERVYFVCVRNDIYNGMDIVLPTYIGGIDFNKFLDKKEDIDEK